MSYKRAYLLPREASAVLRANGFTKLNVSNLAVLREMQRGPPYIRCGSDIFYPVDPLVEWMRARLSGPPDEGSAADQHWFVVMGRWHAEHPFDIMTGRFEAKDRGKKTARPVLHYFDIMTDTFKRKC